MVLESWESIPGNQNVPLLAWVTFMSDCGLHAQNWPPWSSWMSPGYRTWTTRQKKSCSTFWSSFGVLEVKDDLYRACRKQWNKTVKNFVHGSSTGYTSWICNNWTAGVMAVSCMFKLELADLRNRVPFKFIPTCISSHFVLCLCHIKHKSCLKL